MKKLFAILLLLAFATYYIPVVKALVWADSTCLVDLEEEKTPEKKKNNTADNKDVKEFLSVAGIVPLQVTLHLSYLYTSHFTGDNPAVDILTPPPNRA